MCESESPLHYYTRPTGINEDHAGQAGVRAPYPSTHNVFITRARSYLSIKALHILQGTSPAQVS